jgi:hypothetical protein
MKRLNLLSLWSMLDLKLTCQLTILLMRWMDHPNGFGLESREWSELAGWCCCCGSARSYMSCEQYEEKVMAWKRSGGWKMLCLTKLTRWKRMGMMWGELTRYAIECVGNM